MKCVWAAAPIVSPSTTAVSYGFITAAGSMTSFGTTENQRTCPISEDITVTKLTVWVGTAPGAGSSYAFTIRDDAADTAASVTISGTNTTGSWTGSVSIAALSMICLSVTPTSSPSSVGAVIYWTIEYTTSGNYYLMPGANTTAASTSATNYVCPVSGYSQSTTTTATDWEIIIPVAATVTKLVAALDVAPGTGKSYAMNVRLNNTTDVLTATVSDANTIATATGSQALAAADTLVIKVVPTGTPAAGRTKTCLTIVPNASGEIIAAQCGTSGPSTTATTYQQFYGTGPSTGSWNTSESARLMRSVACTIKNFYFKTNTAPGTGASWVVTVRSAQVDTTVVATLSDTNTVASDTTHTATHNDGDYLTMRATRSGSPGSTGGSKMSFVQVIPQPATTPTNQFFAVL